MSIENLRSALPSYAKDMNLNLSSVVVEIAAEAKEHLSDTAYEAALGAASIMGMNNIFYRTRGFLNGAYDDQRANLRMQIIGKNGGIEKLDFEMYALAVSAVNGCSHCVEAHEHTLREEGATKEQVNDLIRVAATLGGVAQGIQLAEALGSNPPPQQPDSAHRTRHTKTRYAVAHTG